MNTDSQIKQLSQEYVNTRPNALNTHKKLAVVFLASSGSGKSTIRSILVERMGATYVCNDEVRDLIKNAGADMSLLKPIVDSSLRYMDDSFANHFIVFDSNMSSYYMKEDSYINKLRAMGYEIFIVAIDLHLDELRQRVIHRNRQDKDDLLEELPAQYDAQLLAMKDLHPDFVIEKEFNPDELVSALNNRLLS